MQPLYIFDLDGTLADTEHRLHHIAGPKKDWRAFFAASVDDTPIPAVVETYRSLRRGGAETWIWTGRSDEVKAETETWLKRYDLWDTGRFFRAPEAMLMRKAGDYRPDHVIKAEWLSLLDPPEYKRLTAVFEDRDRVVQMWRESGLRCMQVAPGAF